MNNFTLCVPCLFGLEGPVGDELRRLGFSDVRPENGRVLFSGTARDIAKANICLRHGERVLIQLKSFRAMSFEDLFQGVKSIGWENFIPKNGKFPIKGHSLNSQLHSIPDCQKIIKKAVADRLGGEYGSQWLPEDGELYQIQFAIMKDEAYIYLDTTGAGLHKRGYRPETVIAPLRETLASAMVGFARYRGKGDFCDPFCGSGTILIEAALMAKNIAPGRSREFSAEKWHFLPADIWQDVKDEAKTREFSGEYSIFGGDIDPKAIEVAKRSAQRAGVDDMIQFSQWDAREFDRETKKGVIVTNPPYGERIMEKRQAEELYKGFGKAFGALENWQLYLLSSHTEFERSFGKQADKKRKLYNGMIKTDLFMYR